MLLSSDFRLEHLLITAAALLLEMVGICATESKFKRFILLISHQEYFAKLIYYYKLGFRSNNSLKK